MPLHACALRTAPTRCSHSPRLQSPPATAGKLGRDLRQGPQGRKVSAFERGKIQGGFFRAAPAPTRSPRGSSKAEALSAAGAARPTRRRARRGDHRTHRSGGSAGRAQDRRFVAPGRRHPARHACHPGRLLDLACVVRGGFDGGRWGIGPPGVPTSRRLWPGATRWPQRSRCFGAFALCRA